MMKLDSKLLRWILLGGLGLSVVVFFIVMFSGLSLLAGQSRKMVSLKAQSQADDALLTNLEQTKKQVEQYSYFKTVAQTVIPNDKDQAAAVFEINQFAAKEGILIQSITFPPSNLGLGTSSLGTSASASAGSTNAISQAIPVTGIPGLYSLQLTISPQSGDSVPLSKQVTYAKMLNFLKDIENNRRTAQITQINIQRVENKPYLNFALSINVFIRP